MRPTGGPRRLSDGMGARAASAASAGARRAVVAAVGLLAVLLAVTPAGAQQESVDVAKLPLNLARVQRALRASATQESREGLNLKYLVSVYGQAPRIQLFTKADNLAFGRAPYGGPTHREILDVITPKEFRAPVADVGALFRWLTDKAPVNRR